LTIREYCVLLRQDEHMVAVVSLLKYKIYALSVA